MTAADWWGAELIGSGADDLLWARAGRAVTRGELRAQVATLEALFGRLGVGPGSTVALRGALSFTQLWALFAVWARGAQAMLFDPRLRGDRLREQFALHRPQYVVTFGGPGHSFAPFRDECELIFRRLPGARPTRSEHQLIQFTSGTTGATKAVGRTVRSLLDELAAFRSIPGMPTAGDRVLLLESPVYSFGLIGGVLSGTGSGAIIVFAPDQRADRLVRTAAETAATVIIGNPRHFDMLASIAGNPALPALRLAVSSGETLPRAVYGRFATRYGVRIGQAYGITETGIIAAHLAGEYGPSVVGTPVPGIRTRVTTGELQIYLPQSPYLNEVAPTSGGRWLGTNDLATQDPATGAIRLRGRINSAAGSPAHPIDVVEIETVLREHQQVTEAVVLAGDEIEAYVEGTETLRPTELITWCRRRLGQDRAPTRCYLVPSIPRTLNGKLIRNREWLGAFPAR